MYDGDASTAPLVVVALSVTPVPSRLNPVEADATIGPTMVARSALPVAAPSAPQARCIGFGSGRRFSAAGASELSSTGASRSDLFFAIIVLLTLYVVSRRRPLLVLRIHLRLRPLRIHLRLRPLRIHLHLPMRRLRHRHSHHLPHMKGLTLMGLASLKDQLRPNPIQMAPRLELAGLRSQLDQRKRS